MIVHGPGFWRADPVTPGGFGRFQLPCCKKALAVAAPGLVTSDPSLVTCDERARFDVFVERFDRLETVRTDGVVLDEGWMTHRPEDDVRGAIRLMYVMGGCQFFETEDAGKLTSYFWAPGSWIHLEHGTLDIGIWRDFAVGFGDRWRPWKRHLRRFPSRVWRWFGWSPFNGNDFEMFREEWTAPQFVRVDP